MDSACFIHQQRRVCIHLFCFAFSSFFVDCLISAVSISRVSNHWTLFLLFPHASSLAFSSLCLPLRLCSSRRSLIFIRVPLPSLFSPLRRSSLVSASALLRLVISLALLSPFVSFRSFPSGFLSFFTQLTFKGLEGERSARLISSRRTTGITAKPAAAPRSARSR